MINNKKGLSTIVTTLILILLVLVAVGVIWIVVKNIIDTGSEDVDVGAKCLSVDVKATAVACTGTTCAVTLSRKAGGDDIGGVKLVFGNASSGTASTTPTDISGNIAPLITVTQTGVDTAGVADSDFVGVTVYFADSSGNEKLCSTTNSFSY